MQLKYLEWFERFMNLPESVQVQQSLKEEVNPKALEIWSRGSEKEEQTPIVTQEGLAEVREEVAVLKYYGECVYALDVKCTIHIYNKRYVQTAELSMDSGVLDFSVSEDDQILCVAFRAGVVTLYEMQRNYAKLDEVKFEIPYNFEFTCFLCQNPAKVLDYYEILFADDQANASKVHVSIFKLFDKRACRVTPMPLLDRAQCVSHSQSKHKQWWVEKTQELKLVYQSRRKLFQVQRLHQQHNDKAKCGFVAYLTDDALDIYKVLYGTKETNYITIAYRFPRPDAAPLIHKFNDTHSDKTGSIR